MTSSEARWCLLPAGHPGMCIHSAQTSQTWARGGIIQPSYEAESCDQFGTLLGDSLREVYAAALQDAYADNRITYEGLQERLGQLYQVPLYTGQITAIMAGLAEGHHPDSLLITKKQADQEAACTDSLRSGQIRVLERRLSKAQRRILTLKIAVAAEVIGMLILTILIFLAMR